MTRSFSNRIAARCDSRRATAPEHRTIGCGAPEFRFVIRVAVLGGACAIAEVTRSREGEQALA